jgi:hypothetical protein
MYLVIFNIKIMKYIYLPLACFLLIFSSCKKDEKQGCTDPSALNYSIDADKDDGSCSYSILGVWNANSRIVNGIETISNFIAYQVTINPNSTFLVETYDNTSLYTDIEGTYTISNGSNLLMQNTYQNDYDGLGWFTNNNWTSYECSSITSTSATMTMTSSNWGTPSGVSSLVISLSK